MRRETLKGTDLNLSVMCLGTGNFGEKLDRNQAFGLLDRFKDMGGNFIDTANVYCKWIPGMGNSSEQYLGAWLKARKAASQVTVATKGGHYDFSNPCVSRVNEKDIRADLDESLKTLGTDHIDFYWLHRDDEERDIGDILEVMEAFVRQGKIRYYGASNYRKERLLAAGEYAAAHGLKGFSAVSNQWSAAGVNPGKNLNRDKSLVKMDSGLYRWHEQYQVPVVPYSSSAHGFFSKLEAEGICVPGGEVTDEDVAGVSRASSMPKPLKEAYLNRRNLKLYGILCRAAKAYGVSVYAMTQAYFFGRPFQVFPVGAVSRPEQLADILAAGECVLDHEMTEIFKECGVE